MRARHFASYASKGAYVKPSKTFKSAATPNKEVSFFHCCNFDSYLIKEFMSNSINLHCWKMFKLHSRAQTKSANFGGFSLLRWKYQKQLISSLQLKCCVSNVHPKRDIDICYKALQSTAKVYIKEIGDEKLFFASTLLRKR